MNKNKIVMRFCSLSLIASSLASPSSVWAGGPITNLIPKGQQNPSNRDPALDIQVTDTIINKAADEGANALTDLLKKDPVDAKLKVMKNVQKEGEEPQTEAGMELTATPEGLDVKTHNPETGEMEAGKILAGEICLKPKASAEPAEGETNQTVPEPVCFNASNLKCPETGVAGTVNVATGFSEKGIVCTPIAVSGGEDGEDGEDGAPGADGAPGPGDITIDHHSPVTVITPDGKRVYLTNFRTIDVVKDGKNSVNLDRVPESHIYYPKRSDLEEDQGGIINGTLDLEKLRKANPNQLHPDDMILGIYLTQELRPKRVAAVWKPTYNERWSRELVKFGSKQTVPLPYNEHTNGFLARDGLPMGSCTMMNTNEWRPAKNRTPRIDLKRLFTKDGQKTCLGTTAKKGDPIPVCSKVMEQQVDRNGNARMVPKKVNGKVVMEQAKDEMGNPKWVMDRKQPKWQWMPYFGTLHKAKSTALREAFRYRAVTIHPNCYGAFKILVGWPGVSKEKSESKSEKKSE